MDFLLALLSARMMVIRQRRLLAVYLRLIGPGNILTAALGASIGLLGFALLAAGSPWLFGLALGKTVGTVVGAIVALWLLLHYLPLFFASALLVLEHQWALLGVSRFLGRKPFEWVRWAWDFARLDFPWDGRA